MLSIKALQTKTSLSAAIIVAGNDVDVSYHITDGAVSHSDAVLHIGEGVDEDSVDRCSKLTHILEDPTKYMADCIELPAVADPADPTIRSVIYFGTYYGVGTIVEVTTDDGDGTTDRSTCIRTTHPELVVTLRACSECMTGTLFRIVCVKLLGSSGMVKYLMHSISVGLESGELDRSGAGAILDILAEHDDVFEVTLEASKIIVEAMIKLDTKHEPTVQEFIIPDLTDEVLDNYDLEDGPEYVEDVDKYIQDVGGMFNVDIDDLPIVANYSKFQVNVSGFDTYDVRRAEEPENPRWDVNHIMLVVVDGTDCRNFLTEIVAANKALMKASNSNRQRVAFMAYKVDADGTCTLERITDLLKLLA